MSVDLVRRVARMTGDVVRIVALCAVLEDLDRRALLLDAAGKILEQLRELLVDVREPGDGGLQTLALLRRVLAEHATLSRECEAELRVRARRVAAVSSGAAPVAPFHSAPGALPEETPSPLARSARSKS